MYRKITTRVNKHLTVVLLLIIATVMFTNVDALANNRKMLVEIFTSTFCPLCPRYIPPVQDALEEGFDDFIFIQYHCWWTGDDPWYYENYERHLPGIDDMRARIEWIDFDNRMHVPSFFYDGHRIDYHAGNIVENSIDYVGERIEVDSPLRIEIEALADGDRLLTTVRITSESILSNVVLFRALCEKEIEYNAPSGQRRFTGNVLDIFPDCEGVRFSIVRNFEAIYEAESPLNVGWCDNELDNLQVVAWVQRPNNEIVQSENADIELLSAPENPDPIPVSTQIEAAYPNPFNSTVTIPFSLNSNRHVLMTLHDLTGREIVRLIDGKLQTGKHTVSLNADKYGMTNGIYYLKFISGDRTYSQKMVYLR